MPARRTYNARRRLLLCGCALGALGWITIGIADAQSADPGKPVTPNPPAAAVGGAGGLDMDATPAASPAATGQTNVGGLDMDVNPAAPAPAAATPAATSAAVSAPGSTPASASASTHASSATAKPAAPATATPGTIGNAAIRALSPDNVQAGARISTVNPAPLEGAPENAPATQPLIATPPATTLATPAPAAAQPEPINLDHPTVVDTADLKAGDATVSLYGIEGLQGDPAQGLQSFLAATADRLTCQAQPNAGYVCLLPDGTDIAEVALVNGAARAKDDAPDGYRDQEAAAQAARRGIWSSLPPPPVTVTHPIVQDTATLVADGQTYVLNGVVGLGAPYASQLQGYIVTHGDSLTCQPQIEPGQYICMLSDGTDIAKVALVNGAARVDPDAPDSYRTQQLEALNNRRGFWQSQPADVLLAATSMQPVGECCTYVPGDDGTDGITYVGGEPEAVIDGAPVFLVFGGALGWGYYDHWHHWRGAPDRYRSHLDRYHPDGRGLRGYGHNAELRHDVAMHREEAVRHDNGLRHEAVARPGVTGATHPGMAGAERPGFAGTTNHPGYAGAGQHPGYTEAGPHPGYAGTAQHPGYPEAGPHPGYAATGQHPGYPEAGNHPGYAATGQHPGYAGTAGHPGYAGTAPQAGVAGAQSHPAMAGGFVHPGPSAGGFHPGGGGGAPAFHPAAPAMHAAAAAPSAPKKH